jgi:peptidoglycan-associated lipoprotein
MEETMNKLTSVLALAATAALIAAATGCSDPPPPKTADDTSSSSTSSKKGDKKGDAAKSDTDSNVQIDNKIIAACGDLPTAHFGFDSADVQADAANALDALARCFVSGPLKGRSMKLIGHADPRGETEYNLALGQKRAGGVAGFLAKKGVEQGKMLTSSKGEFEATGTDEAGWARDRKVEVLLAE